MVDLIYPSNGEGNYPDDEFFNNDLKFESADEMAAPEGSGLQSGEASGIEFGSGTTENDNVSGAGETTSNFSKHLEDMPNSDEVENNGNSRASKCCIIE